MRLSTEEVRHLRAAIRNTARAYGGSEVLAQVMGVTIQTVYRATAPNGRGPSGVLAIRLAKAAGMSVEAVLGHGGAMSEAGRCKACGARIGHAADRRVS